MDTVEFIQLMWLSGGYEERVNLRMDGYTIYASREEGQHGPRIKFYKASNKEKSVSVSISNHPQILVCDDTEIERAYGKYQKEVVQWVLKNRAYLMRFWTDDQYLTQEFKNDVLQNK